jgi:hypothetical protein
MSSTVRWGGLAGVAAGVMFVLSSILTLIAPPQRELGSFGGYLIEVVIVVAFALAMVAIAGVHAAQRLSRRYGGLGAAGALLTFVGYAIVLVAAHVTTLAGGEPVITVRLVGGLAVLDTHGSHDPARRTTSVVVRGAAHRRLPARGHLGGGRGRGQREHRARDSVGVNRLCSLVAKQYGGGATLTRELSFCEHLPSRNCLKTLAGWRSGALPGEQNGPEGPPLGTSRFRRPSVEGSTTTLRTVSPGNSVNKSSSADAPEV